MFIFRVGPRVSRVAEHGAPCNTNAHMRVCVCGRGGGGGGGGGGCARECVRECVCARACKITVVLVNEGKGRRNTCTVSNAV